MKSATWPEAQMDGTAAKQQRLGSYELTGNHGCDLQYSHCEC